MPKPKKVIILFIFLWALTLAMFELSPASGAYTYSYVSAFDSYTPASLRGEYDIQYLQVLVDGNDPNSIIFVAYYAQPLSPNIFKDTTGKDPFGAILIYRSNPGTDVGGDKKDIAIYANNTTLSGNSEITSNVFGNSTVGGTKSYVSGCYSNIWSDLNNSARWLAFKVNKSCAKIPNQFWVEYYSDENSNGGASRTAYDWISGSALEINLDKTVLQNPPSTIRSPFTVSSVSPTPTPTPTLKKLPQSLSTFTNTIFTLSTESLDLPMFTDQMLEISWWSDSTDVCLVDSDFNILQFYSAGLCELQGYSVGNSFYDNQKFLYNLTIWDDYVKKTPTPKAKVTKKPVAKTPPKKTIGGSATTSKKITPKPKTTVNSKIGGSASSK